MTSPQTWWLALWSCDARVTPARRLIAALLAFGLVVIVGTVGLYMVTDAGWFDSLYMTIISVTTVGFGEVVPLNTAGRVLTMAIIVLGVGSLTLATLTAIEFIVEGHLREMLGRRRMNKHLGQLQDHTIVCGFGRVGREAADTLIEDGQGVVIIDPNPERVAMALAKGMLIVEGDAAKEEVLRSAQIERAKGLVACTADDAENILIALTGKGMHPGLFVVVRVKDEESGAKARRAGADRVIAPAQIGGRRIAALITRPVVVDFLDVVTHSEDIDMVLEEVCLTDRSALTGHRLRDAKLRARYGANVLAVRPKGDSMTTRPDPDAVMNAGDVLVVIGSRENLDRLQADQ